MVKKRGLGKSLDALLFNDRQIEHEVATDEMVYAPINAILPGKYQPRRSMDPILLEELASSISKQGIIQPIIARPLSTQIGQPRKYEIIAGERRWRAAQLAKLEEVPVIVREIPDEAAVAVALIENIQREELNPIEEALSLKRLIDEFGMTHNEAAEAVGKSRPALANLLRLLSLPPDIQQWLEQGVLEMGHARALITLPPDVQLHLAQLIRERDLSVRETENQVRLLQTPEKSPSDPKPKDPDIINLQDRLSQQFRLKVAIQCNAKGKGKLTIHYRNIPELENLLAQLTQHSSVFD